MVEMGSEITGKQGYGIPPSGSKEEWHGEIIEQQDENGKDE